MFPNICIYIYIYIYSSIEMVLVYTALLSKALYSVDRHSPVHAHIHTPTAESATQGDRTADRVRASHSGTPHTHSLGGAWDGTSNLQVTSRPALPPDLLPVLLMNIKIISVKGEEGQQL